MSAVIDRVRKYCDDYDDALSWGGQTMYPAQPSIADLRVLLTRLDRATPTPAPEAFQKRVQPWLMACFGAKIAGDREERNHRFLEEALELVQSLGCDASEAHQLVDYVYARPVGEPAQEVGGVMVTLAALCLANDLDMDAAAEAELARIWTKVEAIRAKQAAKPKHSPLPVAPEGLAGLEARAREMLANAYERSEEYEDAELIASRIRRGNVSLQEIVAIRAIAAALAHQPGPEASGSIDRQAQEYACEHIAHFGRGGYLRHVFGDHLAAFAKVAIAHQPTREEVARVHAGYGSTQPWWWDSAFDDGADETAAQLRASDLEAADAILALIGRAS